ncbi:MAG: hypothetical protein HY319_15045 [Armatimonadetes bacterium]|nr:hypothetical protein [Armatimonadota bacterium]
MKQTPGEFYGRLTRLTADREGNLLAIYEPQDGLPTLVDYVLEIDEARSDPLAIQEPWRPIATGERQALRWPGGDYYQKMPDGKLELVPGRDGVGVPLKELALSPEGRLHGVWSREGMDTVFHTDLLNDSRLGPSSWSTEPPRSTWATDAAG